MSDGYPFLKGHGTENDFIVLPDPDGSLHGDLDAALVRALCDRRAGLGADGVLRAVRTEASDDPAAVAARDRAAWFMDYRNADGSLSEMCGNGIRVFARYLAEWEHAALPLVVATRAGCKELTFTDDGLVTADMGRPALGGPTEVRVGDQRLAARAVSMGNPHAVAFVDDLAVAGDPFGAPSYDAGVFPDGVNVELVVRRGERHVAMRVHERGSGETRSCGTGACAVMVAAASADGHEPPVTYTVDVPGGRLEVTWTPHGSVLLTGPAVIVAEGTVPYSFPELA